MRAQALNRVCAATVGPMREVNAPLGYLSEQAVPFLAERPTEVGRLQRVGCPIGRFIINQRHRRTVTRVTGPVHPDVAKMDLESNLLVTQIRRTRGRLTPGRLLFSRSGSETLRVKIE